MSIVYLHQKDLDSGRYFDIPSITSDSGNTYDIEDRIGEGGHAAVYKCARDRQEYAIKFQLNFNQKAVKRFCNSIEVLKKLKHDCLLKHIDSGNIDITKNKRTIKIHFLIMELYENGDLESKLCKEHTEYKYEEYFAYFLTLSDALAKFHKIATHRDIKPANILIGNGRWILADYGLCTSIHGDRITGDHEIVGPRLWMSPEANNKALMVADAEIDEASDVYQLASIFWFVVNHKHPTGILKKSDWCGPEWLFGPIAKALSHDKSKRYKNGGTFYRALKRSMEKSEQ